MTEQEINKRYMKAKNEMELAFKAFQEILSNKVLDKNKTTAAKNNEIEIVSRLTDAANELDMVNEGEGTITLSVIAIREHLVLRDRINKIEYTLLKTMRTLDDLKKDLGDGE